MPQNTTYKGQWGVMDGRIPKCAGVCIQILSGNDVGREDLVEAELKSAVGDHITIDSLAPTSSISLPALSS